MDKPNIIFKYKPLTTRSDIIRYYDIINHQRIFYPTSLQLNDPFEGQLPSVGLGAAGGSLLKKADKEYSQIRNIRNRIHVMSLSEDCFSAQLWAYYCNNYTGVCFCFKTDQTFKDIQKVEYVDQFDTNGIDIIPDLETVEQVLLNRVYQKTIGWKYEKEWRMIRLSQNTEYLNYNEDELIAIILGNNVDTETEKFILSTVPEDLPVFKTYPGQISGTIHIIRHDYELRFDGRKQDFIDTVDELSEAIVNYKR